MKPDKEQWEHRSALEGNPVFTEVRAERDALREQVTELLAALKQLAVSCDTGHRNSDGSQMGVRVPDKSAVDFARAALTKARS